MTASAASDPGSIVRALRAERRRATQFSGWVSLSWLVIFLALGFLFSGVRLNAGPLHFKAISLDLAFMVKWLPFISGYTTSVSAFVPTGLAFVLAGVLIGLRAPSRARPTAAVGLSLAGVALAASGGLLLIRPHIVGWLPQEGVATIGAGASGWRLGLLGLLTTLPALALFYTSQQTWHRPLAIGVALLGGAVLTVGIVLQALHVQAETVQTFPVPLPYLDALGMTIGVSILSILCAVVLALLGALGRISKFPLFYAFSTFYISVIRGTPLVVQVFFVFLALPQVGIVLDPIPSGIVALSVNYGAYMTEVFRAGIQAVGRGQTEAALALGLTPGQTMRHIVLPQAFRIIIPPTGNEFIAMMKDSALVSFMGVWELLFRAQKVGRQYFHSFETLLIAAAFYWMLTIIFSAFQDRLERHMARGERRD
jgi:polar amino acid transport system permease protein